MGKIWSVIAAAAMIGAVVLVLNRLKKKGPRTYDGLACLVLPLTSGAFLGGFIGDYIGERAGYIIGAFVGIAACWYACRKCDRNLEIWKKNRGN